MRKGKSRESKLPLGFTAAEVDAARRIMRRIEEIAQEEEILQKLQKSCTIVKRKSYLDDWT